MPAETRLARVATATVAKAMASDRATTHLIRGEVQKPPMQREQVEEAFVR